MGPELAVVVSLIAVAGCQILPEIACPTYFQYVNDGFGGYQGEVTLPGLAQGRNRIDLRFSQRGNQDSFVVGSVIPYPDEIAVRSSAGPARFRINLQPDPSTGLLPKLSRISYNDQLLCSASEYGPPNSFFNRFYELHVSGSRTRLPSSNFVPFPRDGLDVDVQTLFFESPKRANNVWNGFTPSWTQVATVAPTLSPLPPRRLDPLPTSIVTFPPPRRQPSPPTPPPPPPPPPPTTTTIAPQTTPRSTSRLNPLPSSATVACGQEGHLTPFIYRGQGYPRGQYPWLTAIYHKEARALAFMCGGSLISSTMVITAAHCVYKMEERRVVVWVGRYDLDDYQEDGAEVRDVKSLLSHPDFSNRAYPDADIALVTMERPVVFNDIISPICLWTAQDSVTVASSGFIAGWGGDEKGNSQTQYPRIVEAAIASNTDCASKFKAPRVTERTLCAGNLDGSGPCTGDSGGGLMVLRDNRWLLRGIVSVGERERGRCQLNQYVLYCDLSKHLAWINENIR
ncbi:hypothetical protein KR009_012253 [Drosophila setifemur]|nr:hypothetical protein KR009_012253 [Drosophila setifemur]